MYIRPHRRREQLLQTSNERIGTFTERVAISSERIEIGLERVGWGGRNVERRRFFKLKFAKTFYFISFREIIVWIDAIRKTKHQQKF